MLVFFGLCSPSVQAQEPINVYGFDVEDIDGNPVSLSNYKGKVLLIVNTASRCGFTRQYKPLEELYQKYKDQGLVVLGFPANNFMNQEPGTNEEIKNFCFLNYKTTFPLFSKISVKGKDIHPLYGYLTTQGEFPGAITWNFNKFLIGKDGQVIGRFGARVDPLDPKIVSAIKDQL
ncbi:MAG: glutathione peroxidase [Candidatus Aceula meridiana]|nr:glutathione peroxidase [Candidatus Aceula meridiana]